MKQKTIIKQETWQRLFILNYYQEFIREWLSLYDAYTKSNPMPKKEIQKECISLIIKHFQECLEVLSKDA